MGEIIRKLENQIQDKTVGRRKEIDEKERKRKFIECLLNHGHGLKTICAYSHLSEAEVRIIMADIDDEVIKRASLA